MPTATLITRDGSFVAFLGSSHHQQEVDANDSITIISPQSKQIHQQRQSKLKINTTKKSSQPNIKPSIQTKKKNIKLSTAVTRNRKLCSYEGCSNQARRGGVCTTHGANAKRCSFKGCNNQARKEGVCFTHGATKKRCSFKGCINQARKAEREEFVLLMAPRM